jgi:hypothetical protein
MEETKKTIKGTPGNPDQKPHKPLPETKEDTTKDGEEEDGEDDDSSNPPGNPPPPPGPKP